MHDRQHLLLTGPCIFVNSIFNQCMRRAAAALIEGRDEAGARLHLLELLFVVGARFHRASLNFRYCRMRLLVELSCWSAGSFLLSSSGIIRWASTLPSSTPH